MKIPKAEFYANHSAVVTYAQQLIEQAGHSWDDYEMDLAEADEDLVLACWKPKWLMAEVRKGNYNVEEYDWVSVELPNPYSEVDFAGGAPYKGSSTMSCTGIDLVRDGGWQVD